MNAELIADLWLMFMCFQKKYGPGSLKSYRKKSSYYIPFILLVVFLLEFYTNSILKSLIYVVRVWLSN